MKKHLDALIDENLALGIPGADCAVYKNGKCIYRRTAGVSSCVTQTPLNGREKYNVYSCSKIITCAAALKLWEDGKLNLEGRLSSVLPEYEKMYIKDDFGIRRAVNPILFKHLFNMTAGFTYNLDLLSIEYVKKSTNGRCPTREIIRALANEPLAFEPGERWFYGLSHDVLAAAVEEMSGMKFGEYVGKNIFEPLEMYDSTFLLPDSKLDGVCCQYKYNAAAKKSVPCSKEIQLYKFGTEYESGGAGCVTTLEDYIKFLEGLRTGTILKPETVRMMAENRLASPIPETRAAGYGYGLGVRCPINDSQHDFGWGGAAGAFAMIDPELGISAFYVQHVLSSSVPNTADIPRIVRKYSE